MKKIILILITLLIIPIAFAQDLEVSIVSYDPEIGSSRLKIYNPTDINYNDVKYSIDNQPRLKEFYVTKSTQLKDTLETLNKNTKDKVTQIKLDEVISLLESNINTTKVKDEDLVNLLQYCDLVDELEVANG